MNKTFGNLLVVERYLDYVSKSGYRSVRWKCRCSCGRSEDFPVHSSNLLSGKTTKCSICQYESVSLKKMKNIKGKKYGFLTPIEVDSVSSNGTYWRCLCECGGETVSLVSSIIRGTTKSCGCLSESYISHELKKYCKKTFDSKTEYKIVKNNKTNYYLPYDIYIPLGENSEINGVYIEIHGKQHYEICFWHNELSKKNKTTPEKELKYQKDKDKIKKNFAKKNGTYIEIDLRKIKTLEEAIEFIYSKCGDLKCIL